LPQIIQITSEAIQAQIRRLLPSQQGFSIDMEASSVIQPVIDLTPAAEGSQLPSYLQTAAAYGSQIAFSTVGSTDVFALTPGFYHIVGNMTIQASNTANKGISLSITDGTTPVTIQQFNTQAGGINGEYISNTLEQFFYIRSGESLRAFASADCSIVGSYRQVADLYGKLINPAGFTFE